jgi:hypothetical protein
VLLDEDAVAAKVRVVRLAELLDDVRASRVGNNVRYEISPDCATGMMGNKVDREDR